MSYQKIASALAKAEGKKSQARIGDIRELLRLLVSQEANANRAGPLTYLIQKANEELVRRERKRQNNVKI